MNDSVAGPKAQDYYRIWNVHKWYRGVKALDGVEFGVNRGEIVALVGDNGAGKSTLFKIIAGVIEADEQNCSVAGDNINIRSILDANRAGIYAVYQDLALCDNLDAVSNMYVGSEIVRPWWQGRRLDRPTMEHRVRDIFGTLSMRIPSMRTPVGLLSGGQRQCVAIARAVLRDPALILLDEPTAALGVEQTKLVLDLVMRLKDEGRAVAMVSHNLHDVLQVADRIVVLRLGRTVASFDRASANSDDIVAAITGAREFRQQP